MTATGKFTPIVVKVTAGTAWMWSYEEKTGSNSGENNGIYTNICILTIPQIFTGIKSYFIPAPFMIGFNQTYVSSTYLVTYV